MGLAFQSLRPRQLLEFAGIFSLKARIPILQYLSKRSEEWACTVPLQTRGPRCSASSPWLCLSDVKSGGDGVSEKNVRHVTGRGFSSVMCLIDMFYFLPALGICISLPPVMAFNGISYACLSPFVSVPLHGRDRHQHLDFGNRCLRGVAWTQASTLLFHWEFA